MLRDWIYFVYLPQIVNLGYSWVVLIPTYNSSWKKRRMANWHFSMCKSLGAHMDWLHQSTENRLALIDTSPFTLTITREQPLEYWDVCVTGHFRSASAHLGSLSWNVSGNFKPMASQKNWWERHSHPNPLHPPYLSPTGTNEDTLHSLHPWIEWEIWQGVHFSWCMCSL